MRPNRQVEGNCERETFPAAELCALSLGQILFTHLLTAGTVRLILLTISPLSESLSMTCLYPISQASFIGSYPSTLFPLQKHLQALRSHDLKKQ